MPLGEWDDKNQLFYSLDVSIWIYYYIPSGIADSSVKCICIAHQLFEMIYWYNMCLKHNFTHDELLLLKCSPSPIVREMQIQIVRPHISKMLISNRPETTNVSE